MGAGIRGERVGTGLILGERLTGRIKEGEGKGKGEALEAERIKEAGRRLKRQAGKEEREGERKSPKTRTGKAEEWSKFGMEEPFTFRYLSAS